MYKITVKTLRGYKMYFCYWQFMGRYEMRLVGMIGDAIFYTKDELILVENKLLDNLEKLEIRSYTINQILTKPLSSTLLA